MTELPMYALSVKQPWAWLMFFPDDEVRKDIENRDWRLPAHIRGQRVEIHASKKMDWNEWRSAALLISTRGLKSKVDVPRDEECFEMMDTCGHIIGTVVIADDVTESASPWFEGEHGFVLRDPVALPEPIPCKGALGFWRVPDDIARRIA